MDHAAKGKRMPPISSNFSKDPAPSDLDPSNIFVKYLPSALRDSDLTELFQGYGEVLSSKIMIDPNSRKSLGFGYVTQGLQAQEEKGPFLVVSFPSSRPLSTLSDIAISLLKALRDALSRFWHLTKLHRA